MKISISVAGRLLAVWLLGVLTVQGAEYFVAVDGDDDAAGDSWEQAFRTIGHGVDLLEPGDTLTLGPGSWHESVIFPRNGTADTPIRLRARYPGRTELVGSVRLQDWEPVAGRRQVFRTALDQVTTRVVEKNTATVYREVANFHVLEQEPGTFLYESEEAQLYVHPTDGQGIAHHVIDAALLQTGITTWASQIPVTARHAKRSVGFIVEGLIIRDFADHGIYIANADHCQVLDCQVLYSRCGIRFQNSYKSRVAGCEAAHTYDRYNRESGGISLEGYTFQSVIEHNVAHHGGQHGMRFYGAHYGCIMRHNLTYDCAIGIQIKGAAYNYDQALHYARFSDNGAPSLEPDLSTLVEHNVAHEVTGSAGLIPTLSVYRRNTVSMPVVGTIVSSEHNLEFMPETVRQQGFADPAWDDLRLQADSPHRQQAVVPGALPYGDDVRYVGPEGDDQQRGDSMATAWRTLAYAQSQLQSGETLYLLPGRYGPLQLSNLENCRIRAHGKGDVRVARVDLRGVSRLELGGIQVVDSLSIAASSAVTILACRLLGEAVRVEASSAVRLENCLVTGTLTVPEPDNLWVVNNLLLADQTPLRTGPLGDDCFVAYNYAPVDLPGHRNVSLAPGFVDREGGDFRLLPFSLLRGRGYLGRAIGPGDIAVESAPVADIAEPRIVGVTAHQVDLKWSFSAGLGTLYLQYGTAPDTLDQTVIRDIGYWYRQHHGMTLAGLDPGTRYYLRLGNRRVLEGPAPYHQYRYVWPERGPGPEAEYYRTLAKEDRLLSPLMSFVTPRMDIISARELHVAITGDDEASGTRDEPLRTIRAACAQAQPGDTVIVHEGSYFETIEPVRSGLPGSPITIMAARGERVQIDGRRELLPHGVDIRDRRHLVIRGFIFFGQAEYGEPGKNFGQVRVLSSHDIRIEHCLFDGRMNYVNALLVYRSTAVHIHDNIFVSHHGPIYAHDNEGPLVITHNSFLGPTLAKVYAPRNADVSIRNNLFGEVLFPKKKHQYKLRLVPVGRLDLDYNCYYFDVANDERRILDYLPEGIDLAERTGLPEADTIAERIGVKGSLAAYRDRLPFDHHSVVTDQPLWAEPDTIRKIRGRVRPWPDRLRDYPPLHRESLRLIEDSPCTGAADDGSTIGATYHY